MEAKQYTYQMEWNPISDRCTATVLEFPDLKKEWDSPEAALAGLTYLVNEELDMLKKKGERPPLPLPQRKEKIKKISVRLPVGTHAIVTNNAKKLDLSLNQYINFTLMSKR